MSHVTQSSEQGNDYILHMESDTVAKFVQVNQKMGLVKQKRAGQLLDEHLNPTDRYLVVAGRGYSAQEKNDINQKFKHN